MSTAANAQGQAAYEGDSMSPTPAPTPEDNAMSAIDGAFAPVLARLRADAGPVHSTTLVAVIGSIRQALAHAVYGAPDPVDTTGESLDIATLQKRHATAYAAYLEQCKADGVDPDDLPTYVANQARDDDAAAAQKTDMELAGFEEPDGTLTPSGKAARGKTSAADKLFA